MGRVPRVLRKSDTAEGLAEEPTAGSGEFAIGRVDLPPESDAAAWTHCSRDYQAFAAGATRPFAWDAARLVRIEPGSRVLDVATGTGEFAIAASERGAQVLATDFSRSMLELLEVQSQRRQLSGLATALMDGQALALPDGSFDVCASLFGLVFFPNPTQGLAELSRVLTPGGQVVLATWAPPHRVELMRLVGEALMQANIELPVRDAPASDWTELSQPRRLTQLMQQAGFVSVHAVELAHVWTFDAVDMFARCVLRMTPSWMQLYRAMRQEQRQAFTHALADHFRARQGSGPFAVTAQGVIAVGTKPR